MKKTLTQTLKIKGLAFVLICLANSASAFVTTICDNIGTAQHPVWSCMTLQNVPCSQVGYIAGMTCSEQYFAVPPKILVLTDGSVHINDKGTLSTFAPDKINTFLLETVSKLPKEERQKQFLALLNNGDNKVSKARIEALSKELNAEIIYSKESLATYQSADNPDKAPYAMVLSLGGGITNPASSLKQNANISNGYSFGANLFLPFSSKACINYGINVGGEYFAGNKAYNTDGITPYNITGQTGNPAVSTKETGSPKQSGFKAEAGLQANLFFGQITISPILNAAYISLNQKAFAVTQSSSANGQSKEFNLYSQAETKTNGIAFIPKIQFRYRFAGDSRLSIYAEANYTLGPDIKNQTSSFKPNGAADPKTGAYSIDQMTSGSNTSLTKSNSYKALGVNVGIGFSFLSKRGYDSYKAHSDMARAKGENPLYEDKGLSGSNPLAQ